MNYLPVIAQTTTPVESGSAWLVTQGALGVGCVALGIVVVYQQRKIDKKDQENDALHREIVELQREWRLTEMERSDKVRETLNTTNAVQAALTEKVRVGKGNL